MLYDLVPVRLSSAVLCCFIVLLSVSHIAPTQAPPPGVTVVNQPTPDVSKTTNTTSQPTSSYTGDANNYVSANTTTSVPTATSVAETAASFTTSRLTDVAIGNSPDTSSVILSITSSAAGESTTTIQKSTLEATTTTTTTKPTPISTIPTALAATTTVSSPFTSTSASILTQVDASTTLSSKEITYVSTITSPVSGPATNDSSSNTQTNAFSLTSKIIVGVATVVLAVAIIGVAVVIKRRRQRQLLSRYSTLTDEFGVDEDMNTPSYGYNQSDQDL